MKAKTLDKADLETGLLLEAELSALREKITRANNAYQVFVAILRRRYDAPEETYKLEDWANGFEPVSVSQDDQLPNN